ncbi:DUF305 domain-containing protein [Nonomuraea bangladeshensis]|uniref:DUF305 domain-containing protein n=1 Tax=Nonomuraea bangladeshensis TaxID=404385 RepID=UPI003C3005AB
MLLALAAALMGGCLARGDSAARHAHDVPAPTQARDPQIAHPVTSASVNPTDVAWLQLMIPMDERVLPLLDLGASRSHTPAMGQLAARLRAAHVAELARLRAALHTTALHTTDLPATGPPATGLRTTALHATELPAANPHAGHDMPGMITAAELARLRTAEGPAFDTLFTGHLRAHLRQSQSVTRSEQVSGADPGIKALAAAIERTRTTQLSALGAVERSPS